MLLTYLGMFAVVLGGVLVVDRLSRPAARPWSEVVVGLPVDRAVALPGQSAEKAGLSLRVVKTEFVAAQDLVDLRLSSRAQAHPGQVFFLVTLRLENHGDASVPFRPFARPDGVLLGIKVPRQKTVAPVLPGDVARLGATPLANVTLAPGGNVQGVVGFVTGPSERGLTLLVVPAAEGMASPAFELALE